MTTSARRSTCHTLLHFRLDLLDFLPGVLHFLGRHWFARVTRDTVNGEHVPRHRGRLLIVVGGASLRMATAEIDIGANHFGDLMGAAASREDSAVARRRRARGR